MTNNDTAARIAAKLALRFQVQIDGTQVHSAFVMGDTVWTDCSITEGRKTLTRVEAAVTCARCAKKIAKMEAMMAKAAK